MVKMTDRERFNIIVTCIRGAFLAAARLFFAGTIIQTFLASFGVSSQLIGVHTTLLSVADIVTTMLFSDIADKGSHIKRTVMILGGGMAITFFPMLILCLISGITAKVAFGISLAVGLIQASLLALWNIYSYKMPYLSFDISYYGLCCSWETVTGSLASIGTGILLAWFIKRADYSKVMFFGFLFAVVSYLITVVLNKMLRLEGDTVKNEKKKISPFSAITTLLKVPVFSRLMLPSFLRGLATGVLTMAAVIAMKMGFDASDTSLMVTVSSVSSILGAAFFSFLSRKFDPRDLCLIGSIAVAVFPVIGLGGKELFFAVYFIIMFGKIVVDLSVPTMLYRYISYEIAGEYHAWRLMLSTAGTAVATLLTGFFTESVPAVWIAVVAGLLQLASGLLYRFSPVLKKENIIN